MTGGGNAMIPTSWLEVLVRTTSVAMFVLREGRLVWVNAAAERMTGRSRRDLGEIAFSELVHPEDLESVARKARALRETGEDQSVVCRVVRPDGSAVWITGSITRTESPDGELILGTATDITQRVAAEALELAEALGMDYAQGNLLGRPELLEE